LIWLELRQLVGLAGGRLVLLDRLDATLDGLFVLWPEQVLNHRDSISQVSSEHELAR